MSLSRPNTAIIISDSDEDEKKSSRVKSSPLTTLKTRKFPKSKGRKINPKVVKKQTRLDIYFQTFKVENQRSKKSLSDEIKGSSGAIDCVGGTTADSKPVTLSPPRVSQSIKRSAIKGLSPQPKVANKSSTNIHDLKGDDLWKAVVAQRKKTPAVEPEIPADHVELDVDLEDLLMTENVVHSFPNDKMMRSHKPVQQNLSGHRDISSAVLDSKVKTALFQPKDRIVIKKKTKEENTSLTVVNGGLMTSTPTKHSSSKGRKSPEMVEVCTELFSDSSFTIDDSKSEAIDCKTLSDDYNRHLVIDCSVGDQNTIMLLKDIKGVTKTCELQGYWADSAIKAGDVVNIIGEFDDNNFIRIDMADRNAIVINPDFLVSGSVISSATQCVRRTVLNNRYKGYEGTNKFMLFGSILHEIFQKILISDIRSEMEMKKMAEEIALTASYAHDMYSIGMTEKSLIEGITEYIPSMLSFLNKHVGSRATSKVKISAVKDIEETVWSPRYGMKGKIDVTVEANKDGIKQIVPLELKTGRPTFSAEHKGQVTMYSMMLNEKRKATGDHEKITPGLLVYLKDGSMQEVNNTNAAMKGLINLRNELAHGLLRGVSTSSNSSDPNYTVDPLPEPINQRRICSTCPQLLSCTLHQRAFKDYKPLEGHIMEDLVPDALSHLKESDLKYFSDWSIMLLLEVSVNVKWKMISDIWCKPLHERQSSGLCVSTLTIHDVVELSSSAYIHTMHCSNNLLSTSRLSTGNSVVISEDGSHVVLVTTGQILEISTTHISVLCDRKLSPHNTYCVDSYDFYTGDGTGFTNLARLMEGTPESSHLRQTIIDGGESHFDDFLDDETESLIKNILIQLNPDQQRAITQALLARDYLVIKGYPGTGKTSTIVALVKVLRKLGLSVLITSYTNSAVDNILLKLKRDDIEFLRLGRNSRVHAEIVPHTSESLTKNIKSVDQLASFYSSYHIVGVTCLAISHPMLLKRKFDVCIIDEASQILQPVNLGPLFYAKKFIIVGDNKQLPPLVKSADAKTLGMEKTLLDTLDTASSCVELTYQYRMNQQLMMLPNLLVYDNKLQCGSEEVSTMTISPNTKDLMELSDMWDERVTSSCLTDSLLFLDTSMCNSSPTKKTTVHSNTEAKLVCHVCAKLMKVEVDPNSIGVITPYQAQVQLLKKMLLSNSVNVEVNTVDQYQGRDKSIIIISFARTITNSRQLSSGGGILSDIRRLNVAITRAKHKLILIGNLDILVDYKPVHQLVKTLDSKQIINVPYDWC